MHKPESVRENEMHKWLWDFEIQTDHLIPVRRPDIALITKNKITFSSSTDHKVKIKENKKIK